MVLFEGRWLRRLRDLMLWSASVLWKLTLKPKSLAVVLGVGLVVGFWIRKLSTSEINYCLHM